mgnify:CR=1 FL=1
MSRIQYESIQHNTRPAAASMDTARQAKAFRQTKHSGLQSELRWLQLVPEFVKAVAAVAEAVQHQRAGNIRREKSCNEEKHEQIAKHNQKAFSLNWRQQALRTRNHKGDSPSFMQVNGLGCGCGLLSPPRLGMMPSGVADGARKQLQIAKQEVSKHTSTSMQRCF